MRGHRAGGTIAYEGTPPLPSSASSHFFIGVRDKKEKLTCSHAAVMEMRSQMATSSDSSSALLAGKMSYGESRSELIDTFGSRKVERSYVSPSTVPLTPVCSGEDLAAEDQIVAGGRGGPRRARWHCRMPQRRRSSEMQAHAAAAPCDLCCFRSSHRRRLRLVLLPSPPLATLLPPALQKCTTLSRSASAHAARGA